MPCLEETEALLLLDMRAHEMYLPEMLRDTFRGLSVVVSYDCLSISYTVQHVCADIQHSATVGS